MDRYLSLLQVPEYLYPPGSPDEVAQVREQPPAAPFNAAMLPPPPEMVAADMIVNDSIVRSIFTTYSQSQKDYCLCEEIDEDDREEFLRLDPPIREGEMGEIWKQVIMPFVRQAVPTKESIPTKEDGKDDKDATDDNNGKEEDEVELARQRMEKKERQEDGEDRDNVEMEFSTPRKGKRQREGEEEEEERLTRGKREREEGGENGGEQPQKKRKADNSGQT